MYVRLGIALSATALAAGLLVGVHAPASAGSARGPSCFGAPATIVGTAKSDLLRGTSGRDVIVGRKGADRVYGRGGADLLCGGPGDDLLDGGPGRQPPRRWARARPVPPRHEIDRVRGAAATRSAAASAAPKRDPAPPIEGVTIDGDHVSLADFRGRAVFVNVWASW